MTLRQDFFPLPEPLIKGAGAQVMSLRDGTAKMSKSDPSDLSRIGMMDDADMIAKKIKKAKTDPEPLPDSLDGLNDRPEAKNLVGIYAALSGITEEAVLAEFGGQGFGAFKPALADLAVEKIAPIAEEMRRFRNDPGYLEGVLGAGAQKADAIAAPILKEVKKVVGFLG